MVQTINGPQTTVVDVKMEIKGHFGNKMDKVW